MRQIIDIYGSYVPHLQNVIADTSKKVDRATVKEKLKKLCNSNVLFRCAFFTDILTPAKNFSLEMQKCDAFVVDIFGMGKTTYTYCVKMVEKLRKNPDSAVFELPTLKRIITEIEEKNSEDGEPVYQNQVVESYTQQKQFLKNNVVLMVQSIVDCFTARYKCIELNSNDESTNGDSKLFNVCRILNTKAWANITEVSSLSIFLTKIFLLFVYGGVTFFQSLSVILFVLVRQPF